MALPRTLCAYFFGRFGRILHSICTDFTLQRFHVLISQHVAHASESTRWACVLRTYTDIQTRKFPSGPHGSPVVHITINTVYLFRNKNMQIFTFDRHSQFRAYTWRKWWFEISIVYQPPNWSKKFRLRFPFPCWKAKTSFSGSPHSRGYPFLHITLRGVPHSNFTTVFSPATPINHLKSDRLVFLVLLTLLNLYATLNRMKTMG